MLKGKVYAPRKKSRAYPDTQDQIDFKSAKKRQARRLFMARIKASKNEIIIACVLVAALTFAYYMH
jgi:hypothetical protein